MSKTVSFLRDSNISEYVNIMSSEDVIKALLQSESAKARTVFSPDIIEDKPLENNDELIKVLADVFQSLTTKAMTTKEIIEYIYDRYKPEKGVDAITEIDDYLGDSVKIVHAENYKLTTKNTAIKRLSQASTFNIPKDIPSEDSGKNLFAFDNRYGLTQIKNVENEAGDLILEFADKKDATMHQANETILFNCEEMIDAKIKATSSKGEDIISQKTLFNGRDASDELIQNKDNTSVSVVMLNNPNIRAGTKNSLELSTFLNVLSTIELSKCIPYFNATFILPDAVQNLSGRIFKTASITQFLEGTMDVPWDNARSDFYDTIEASFIKEINKNTKTVTTSGTTANMSIFTMPQTVNNFDEVFIGHNEVLELNKNRLFQRSNAIHDITRPFLTIKSFNIDVAPTQGLMSFKTGKISLILHDRTRMVDIAPFIKPDLFGSFGAEICIEYGWSHLDAQKFNNELSEREINYISEFLDKNRVIEKYIITNSSYRISGNGQVDIDLSIAMRGPVDIRTVYVDIDAPKKISHSHSQRVQRRFKARKDEISRNMGRDENKTYVWMNNRVVDVLFQDLFSITDSANYESATKRKIDMFSSHYAKFRAKKAAIEQWIRSKGRTGGLLQSDAIDAKEFTDYLNKQWQEALPSLNSNYFDNDFQAFKYGGGELQIETTEDVSEESPSETTPTINNKITSQDAHNLISFVFNGNDSYESVVSSVYSSVNSVINRRKNAQNEIVKKLIGGLGRVDPFFDKHLYAEYLLYAEENYNKSEITAIRGSLLNGFLPIYGIKPYKDVQVDKAKEKERVKINRKIKPTTEFVTFGCVVTAIITSHLSCLGKFDEIQLVSYTVNSYAGLMSNRNIMSFLIDRKDLQDFLFKLFSKEAKFTIESLMTQICQRFISTRDQPCYGLSGLYKREGDKNIAPKNKNIKKHQQSVNEALKRIYTKENGALIDLEEVVFKMPKIKFSFDTLSTKESGYLKTISRISIFDQQDNPFGSVKQIMEKVYDENIITAAARINKLRAESLSQKDLESDKKGKRTRALDKFYQKSKDIVQSLIDKGILEADGSSFRVKGSFKSNSLKQEFKRIMPSATYGSQNTALLEASVSTINEANLNTVYLTRPDRNLPGEKAKISFGNDLPLRILPSQADITMYGCPFVNFAQYIFLDFETGTTVDNTYAVTGIKHDMSPGKFTTTLNLSYGDVYGKYENAVKTISKYLPEDKQKDLSLKVFSGSVNIEGITGTEIPSKIQTTVLPPVDDTTFYNNKVLDSSLLNDFYRDGLNLDIKFDLKQTIYSYESNDVYITSQKSRTSDREEYTVTINFLIDYKTTYNKVINYKLNLFESPKIKTMFEDYLMTLQLSEYYFYFFNFKMIKPSIKENKYYYINDATDAIKLCFSFTDMFLVPEMYKLGLYYNASIKPLTSGLYEFNPNESKIQVDLPTDFSLFSFLKETNGFNWNNDIMSHINEVFFKNGYLLDDLLYVRFKNNKNHTVRKVEIVGIINKKVKIKITYDKKTKKGTAAGNVDYLYYTLSDDENLSRYFKDTIKSVFKDKFFNFVIDNQIEPE